jgi:hypothetical protein
MEEHLSEDDEPGDGGWRGPTPDPGCEHGGDEDYPAEPCHACRMSQMIAKDRFGLWKPVPSVSERPTA